MLVGFIHGVMNTDNMTISGETIDYGPCAFMEAFDPVTVFSSIDHGGRYAYANQPRIAQWNLARLGETLLPLLDDDPEAALAGANAVLQSFPDRYRSYWDAGIRAKLGLTDAADELVDHLLALLHAQQVDFTSFMRALSSSVRGATSGTVHSTVRVVSRLAARVPTSSTWLVPSGRTTVAVTPWALPKPRLATDNT